MRHPKPFKRLVLGSEKQCVAMDGSPSCSLLRVESQASGTFLRVHGDALEEAQRDHANHQVAAPVADERQRDAGDRHEPHRHPYVHEDVEEEDGGDAGGDEDAEAIPGDGRDVEYPPDEDEEQPQEQDAPDETSPLGQVGEDKVGVVLRQEAQVGERGGVQALASDAAGPYSDLGLEDLIALGGDPRGVEERREARYLVLLEEPKLDSKHREYN